ncbi:MAG: TIR domain-containing protein [Thermotogota bacterium]|nr:TIR domain-containing protein [Thermotogota bacterium]
MTDIRYDIAISFAGEDRKIAETLANRLDSSGYSVFYDEFEIYDLWGSDLSIKLGNVYGGMARFCLIIVSKHYLRKMWTNHERQFAISNLLEKGNDYILQLKLDDSELPGISPTIAYLRLNHRSIDEIYKILLRKLGAPLGLGQKEELKKSGDGEKIKNVIEVCYRRAVFTRMDSEIHLPSMFTSLHECLREIQKILPSISDQGLQYLVLQIVMHLDEIERIGKNREKSEKIVQWSNSLPSGERQKIDEQKIPIIKLLLELRREVGIAISLPTALNFDHFYSLDEANQVPRNLL